MKKLSLSLLLLVMAIASKAQKIDTVYFNANWEKTDNSSYDYYRIAERENNLFFVKDYYKSNQLQMKGVFKSLDPEIKQGNFVWYFPNGKVSKKSYFENNIIKKTKIWNKNGELINVNRSVFWADAYITGTFKEMDSKPTFPSGEIEMNKFIYDNLKYPEEMSGQKITGSVTLKFTVSIKGEITNIKVRKTLHPTLDNEAIRVLKMMPRWQPARQNNHFVKMQATQTFNFNP